MYICEKANTLNVILHQLLSLEVSFPGDLDSFSHGMYLPEQLVASKSHSQALDKHGNRQLSSEAGYLQIM